MKYNLLFLLLFLKSIIVIGQEKNKELKDIELNKLDKVKSLNSDLDTKLERNIYNQHFENIKHSISRGYDKENIISDPNLKNFIKKAFSDFETKNTLKSSNPSTFYILKDNSPNASSLGYNYFMINSGLFLLFDNEYQLYAVLSHELAHNYLEHTKIELKRSAEFLKEFKKEIRSIKKSEFLKLIKSQDEQIQKKYDLAAQSRAKELQADSLGFIYYSALNYPKSEYLKALQKLEQFDSVKPPEIKIETYKNILAIEGINFNQKWFKLEKNALFEGLNFTEYTDKDSVRTHPNIKDRINWITNNFKFEKDDQIKPSVEFLKHKRFFKDNKYEYYFNNNLYAIAVYELFLEKQANNNDSTIDKNIAIAFGKLHDGRLKHEFNKYVSIADPNHENINYNEFLQFLWNLSTDELKIISDYYTKKAT